MTVDRTVESAAHGQLVQANASSRGTGGLPQRRPVRRTPREIGRRTVLVIVLVVLAGVFAMPLLWMLSASLKPENEVLASPPNLVPSTVQWENYARAADGLLPFFLNSVQLAVLNVTFLLFFAALAGYGFARLEFVGKNIAFGLLLSTALIPSMVYLIPQYMLFREIGWIDTHYPLWVPNVLTPVFGTFLLRQAFRGVPKELEEAAKLDGCGALGTFARIVLPLAKPALATLAVFTLLGSWNDLVWPLVAISDERFYTLQVGLTTFQGTRRTQFELLMAGNVVATMPLILGFILAQRWFVASMTFTGLKR
jgi:multiple sugar transport system permease protein